MSDDLSTLTAGSDTFIKTIHKFEVLKGNLFHLIIVIIKKKDV